MHNTIKLQWGKHKYSSKDTIPSKLHTLMASFIPTSITSNNKNIEYVTPKYRGILQLAQFFPSFQCATVSQRYIYFLIVHFPFVCPASYVAQ